MSSLNWHWKRQSGIATQDDSNFLARVRSKCAHAPRLGERTTCPAYVLTLSSFNDLDNCPTAAFPAKLVCPTPKVGHRVQLTVWQLKG